MECEGAVWRSYSTSAKRFRRASNVVGSVVLTLFLAGLTASPASAQVFTCAPDAQGANKPNSNQVDLTRMCVAAGSSPYELFVKWDWDFIALSGGNTGDACSLFDTSTPRDGMVDLAVCAIVSGSPATLQDVALYTCNNTQPDKCAGHTLKADGSTSCTVAQANDDPFPAGDPYPQDTVATCSVDLDDFGTGASSASLIDACSFPSGQPNSNPFDCVLRDTTLTCSTNTQCNDDNPCTQDSCDTTARICVYANAGSSQTCNGTTTNACENQDTCSDLAGTCVDNGFKAAGTSCGSSSSGQCDGADTCDGSGQCLSNQVADGTNCGDAGTACTNQDTCLAGQCHDNGFTTAGTACGSSTDNECTNPDTCNGSGICQANNEPNGTSCGDAGTECTNQDTCQAGACQDSGFKTLGTACGSSSDNECDNPDTCNGAGACQVNNEANGTSCGDSGTACTNQDTCQAGTCQDNGYKSAGTTCGSSTDTVCDNPDTCNGSGTCLANNEPDGTSCVGGFMPISECTNQDTCLAGECHDNGFKDAGTACGSNSDTVCDNPDTCNGSGICQANNEANGTSCGDAGTECTNQDTCEAGACQDNGYKSAGTTCGSGADNECDNPDTCNGSGICQANNEANGTSCGDAGTECTNQDTCQAGACQDNGFQAPGTTCGSSNANECDNPDTCNGTGTCETNNFPDGTNCTGFGVPSSECTNQDTCLAGACHDNGFKDPGTACGSNGNTECDNPDTCDGAGTCQVNYDPPGAACGDVESECTLADACDGAGSCTDNGFKSIETTCGDPTDNQCNNPDHCSGTDGTCVNAVEPETTTCGDAAGACTNQDYCDGAGGCTDKGFKSVATACGDPTDDECNNPDHCSGTDATCVNAAEPPTTMCGGAAGECTNQDYCNGTGGCTDNGFKDPGTTCGSDEATECDSPDTCDGTGGCVTNHVADGTSCGGFNSIGGDCTIQDTCLAGECHDNGFQPATTPCGDSTDNACDNPDHCSGTDGSCVPNYEPAGTACGDGAGECTNADSCDGAGNCSDNGFKSAETACGDSSSTDCDAPDHCSGTDGNCIDAVDPDTTVCRADAGDCDVEEKCDGTSKTCGTDLFEPEGTSCGDGTDNDCTNPDTCDDAGACLPNNEECGYLTNSNLCTFDYDATLEGRQFNVIYTPDGQIWPGYKLNATNPGQFYYNAIVYGDAGATGTVIFTIPWPFITQGANPVHLYDAEDIDIDQNLCFRDAGQLPVNGVAFPATITYADWASGTSKTEVVSGGYSYTVQCESPGGALPNNSGYTCAVTVTFPIPASGEAYVNIHLDYAVKGPNTNFNPVDNDVDRYDRGFNTCVGDTTYYDALKNDNLSTPAGPLALETCTIYAFAHSGLDSGSDTVQNVNTFKRINGAFGLAFRSEDGYGYPDVPVALVNNAGQVVATGVTDQDGYYALPYKHTGKPADFTVVLGTVMNRVTLKANGWAEVNYDTTTGTWFVEVSGPTGGQKK